MTRRSLRVYRLLRARRCACRVGLLIAIDGVPQGTLLAASKELFVVAVIRSCCSSVRYVGGTRITIWTMDCERQSTMDDGRWTMDDGRWTMDDGRWTMDDGRWTMDDGRWKMTMDEGGWTGTMEYDGGRGAMDDGRWTMDDGRWTMDDGRWMMGGTDTTLRLFCHHALLRVTFS